MPPLSRPDRENTSRRQGYLVLPALSASAFVTYATRVVTTVIVCARCGREAPTDPAELAKWRCGKLALEGEVAEGLLLCPDCDADDRAREFEEGEGG